MSKNVPADENSAPTPRQQSVLPVMASTFSISEAARQAQLSPKTLHRWLKDKNFRRELARQQQEAAELARFELQGLMLESVAVLSDALRDPNPSIRLRALRIALACNSHLNEVHKLRQEIKDLEDYIK